MNPKAFVKRWIKEIIAFVINCTGLPLWIRHIYARHKVTILLYHNPLPHILEKHMQYLNRRYHLTSMDTIVTANISNHWDAIPPKSLVITIDDGHQGNIELLTIFQKYNVKPTIYLCSQIMNTRRQFWMRNTGKWDVEVLKRYKNEERLNILKRDNDFWLNKEYRDAERQTLNAKELLAMQNYVVFGSHTRFHSILTTCSDKESYKEITESKKDLEQLLQTECKHFSYPNGDYAEREIAHVKQAGYLSARTIDIGWNSRETDPFKLKITGVSDNASINLLIAEMTGVIGYLSFARRGSFLGKHPVVRCPK